MASSSPQFKLRIPHQLKDWLQQRAKKNFRSANAEIVSRLEESKTREEAAITEGSKS